MDLGAASRVRRAATDFVGAEIDGVMRMDQGDFHGTTSLNDFAVLLDEPSTADLAEVAP